ncbi:MAG TPA: zf-HC2 domain-containing protein [Streptosporangiaceae bacterium]|nr:zf-HC2 domain-containing protein [Streptosporangiaceae bacterium]
MSDPACRTFRELLGVYVVGAIEPNERSVVDSHLNQCYGCREELASLAVLPALLHRIPSAEAEQLAQPDEEAAERDDPAPQVLARLLDEVGARRRARRLRGVLAAAAALIIAVGGGVGVSAVTGGQPRPAATGNLDVVSTHRGNLSMTVTYGGLSWGTQMSVKVRGVHAWTWCKFWVTTADGSSMLAGGWLIGPNGDGQSYPAEAHIQAYKVTGFILTANGRVLMHVPAS